jgi:hypothetical protein
VDFNAETILAVFSNLNEITLRRVQLNLAANEKIFHQVDAYANEKRSAPRRFPY